MDQDIPSNLINYNRSIYVINSVFRLNLVLKHTTIKACKTIATPVLMDMRREKFAK